MVAVMLARHAGGVRFSRRRRHLVYREGNGELQALLLVTDAFRHLLEPEAVE